MVATILELAGALVILTLATILYIWTRRTEADAIYEPRTKSEDEANALRLGIALNNPGSLNVNGR